MTTWLGSDSHFAILAVLLLVGLAELLLCWLRRPHYHLVSHRKLRAASARRGPAAGLHARCNAPAAGAQLSREFWHQEWLAEHQRFTHRGSAVPSSVETLPAVGTETVPAAGQLRDAFLPPLASRRGSVTTDDVEPQPVAGGTHMTPVTGPSVRVTSSRQAATARTDPATGGRSPVAGPKQPVGVGAPRHGADRCSTPRSGEINEGHEGAVVPEATAPTRSAA